MPLELNETELELEKPILVENTTKEQRIEIVKKGMAFANINSSKELTLDMYDDYIEGRKELREVVNTIIEGLVNENE